MFGGYCLLNSSHCDLWYLCDPSKCTTGHPATGKPCAQWSGTGW